MTNGIIFTGQDTYGLNNLWVTNGTAAGTAELSVVAGVRSSGGHPALDPSYETALGNKVLFNGYDTSGDPNLWVTNGTADGTSMLFVTGVFMTGGNFDFNPYDLTVFGSEVLFGGTDANDDINLWLTNGTASGTSELSVLGAELKSGHQDLTPSELTAFGSKMLFAGIDANDQLNVWVTNGTGAGTSELAVMGAFSNGGHQDLAPGFLTAFGSEALFYAYDASENPNLWVTNGTGSGTSELSVSGAYDNGGHPYLAPIDLTVFGSKVLFNGVDVNHNQNLWVTNGTGPGTSELSVSGTGSIGGQPDLDPNDLTVFGSEVLFNGFDANGDTNLWVTNGTGAGTSELSVAGAFNNGGHPDLQPGDLTVFGSEVLFYGYDANDNANLWVTNGTAAGTSELNVAGAYAGGLSPIDMTLFTNYTFPATWTQIDNGTPVAMTAGDFENIGSAQIAASYTGAGTYLWANGVGFNKIDNGVPNLMTSGDFAGLGHPQLAGVFAGYGTYTYSSGVGWTKIDNGTPDLLTSGDYRGLGHAQLAGVFTGYGTYTWSSSTGWIKIDNGNPALLTSGDFYGSSNGNNNNADLAGFFPGYGSYIWSLSTGWTKIDAGTPTAYAAGNFLGTSNGNNNQTDLAAYFAGSGTYIWSANGGWSKIDSGAASGLAAVDLNGNGQNELLAYFPGSGMYEWQNGVGWSQYDSTSALPTNAQQALFATGNFQGGSVVDAAVAFNGAAGMWLDPPAGATSSGSSAQSNASSAAGTAQVTSQLNPAAFATPIAGSSGTPQPNQSAAFAGTIAGLAGQDQPTLGYSANSGNSGGCTHCGQHCSARQLHGVIVRDLERRQRRHAHQRSGANLGSDFAVGAAARGRVTARSARPPPRAGLSADISHFMLQCVRPVMADCVAKVVLH